MDLVEKFKKATKKDIDFILETYFYVKKLVEEKLKEMPHLENFIPRLPLVHDVEVMLENLIDLYKKLTQIELENEDDYFVVWNILYFLRFVEDLEDF